MTTIEVGEIEADGNHKGEIYGGIYPADNKPIWFSAAPNAMDYFEAAAWAREKGGSLPTREQGNYLDTLKDKGVLKEIFARHSDGSIQIGTGWDAYFWLDEDSDDQEPWFQRFSDGIQDYYSHPYFDSRDRHLPVLSVQR